MNKKEEFIKNIKNNLYKDDEQFNIIITPFIKYLYNKNRNRYYANVKFRQYVERNILSIINNTFNSKEKLFFYMRTSFTKTNYKDLRYIFNDKIKEYTEKHSNDLLKLLQDEDLQELYARWFLKQDIYGLTNNVYKEIFKLTIFKKIVFNNEKQVLNTFNSNIDFYKILPKEYGYLIGTLNHRHCYQNTLFELYDKYFHDILKKSEQLKLIKSCLEINTSDRSLGIAKKNKYLEYTHCLKKIYNNKEYYKILKKLSKKTKLDLKYIISFAEKYDNTDFFINLFSTKINEETIKKIKYLSTSDKIINIANIKNLNDFKLSELMQLEKEDNSKVTIYGGPNSNGRKNSLFSRESAKREVRRINIDGTFVIIDLEYDDHSVGINMLYPELYKELYCDNNLTVFEKALEAINQLNSISFIIEGEACLITIPSNSSIEQKKVLIEWLKNSNKEANIGITIFNKNLNKKEIILSDELSTNEMIEYINNLNNDEKKYTYNM